MNLFFDLSARVKLSVTGADAERFLNGQLSNDIRKATENSAIAACLLTHKGKLNAHLFCTRNQNAYLIDADPELRESLLPRLERYVIADDVRIQDVTDQFGLYHSLGDPNMPGDGECITRSSTRFGEPGYDLWVAPERREPLRRNLSERFEFCDEACAEILRIERGIPRWGRDLTEEIIPIEANLELQTIDYDKGCYIGQEVISRMKMSGQTNKRLCGLIGDRLEPGMKLFSEPDLKEVGWVTSATNASTQGGQIGLGFVKRGFNSPGTKLGVARAGNPGDHGKAETVDLPFPPGRPPR